MPTWPSPIRLGGLAETSTPNTSRQNSESMLSSVYSLCPTAPTVLAISDADSVAIAWCAHCYLLVGS